MCQMFIVSGCELEGLSLKLLTERLRTVTFTSIYEYLDISGIVRTLHVGEAIAEEIAATAKKRGGMWVRANPNAPHIKELEQYYICCKTTGAEVEEYREHLTMFSSLPANPTNLTAFMGQLESRLEEKQRNQNKKNKVTTKHIMTSRQRNKSASNVVVCCSFSTAPQSLENNSTKCGPQIEDQARKISASNLTAKQSIS